MAPPLTHISLKLRQIPSCFKCSTIIRVHKKPSIPRLNDYRHITLTSVVMTSFDQLVLAQLKNIKVHLLDALQFAYRAKRSVDDAANIRLHYILQHLHCRETYVWIPFDDISSVFSTIISGIFSSKFSQFSLTSHMSVDHQIPDRQTSKMWIISTGAPQGCILSILLFSLISDCTSMDPAVKHK